MEAKHVRRKVTARVRSRLVGGELCFAEFRGDRFQRGIGMWSAKQVLIPFVFELFFCCLEETALLDGFALSDGGCATPPGPAPRRIVGPFTLMVTAE